MRRSAGITISAVLALVGSGFVLLLVGLVVLGLEIGALTQLPRKASYYPAFAALFYGGLAAWGMATGVGLLKLANGPEFPCWSLPGCWPSGPS
jgi:hypothetical protein